MFTSHKQISPPSLVLKLKNKRNFTEMNSQGSRVEKNTHAQKVQMQKILFTNETCWWNLLVWRNHA